MSSFSERIRELRTQKGSLQKDMALLINITERTYRHYEAGDIDPPSSKAIILADYFDVSLDYLFGRSDDPARH